MAEPLKPGTLVLRANAPSALVPPNGTAGVVRTAGEDQNYAFVQWDCDPPGTPRFSASVYLEVVAVQTAVPTSAAAAPGGAAQERTRGAGG